MDSNTPATNMKIKKEEKAFCTLSNSFAPKNCEITTDVPVSYTHLVWLLALVSLTVAVGVLSGLLPAIIISSSKPIEVVRGTFRAKTKMVFSKFFIVFQNVITITMIAASITMVCQIVHMINAPVGYKTKHLLAMRSVDERQLSAFVGELKGLSCVDRVGKTQGLPLFGSNNWTATYQGQNISFQQFVICLLYTSKNSYRSRAFFT